MFPSQKSPPPVDAAALQRRFNEAGMFPSQKYKIFALYVAGGELQ